MEQHSNSVVMEAVVDSLEERTDDDDDDEMIFSLWTLVWASQEKRANQSQGTGVVISN